MGLRAGPASRSRRSAKFPSAVDESARRPGVGRGPLLSNSVKLRDDRSLVPRLAQYVRGGDLEGPRGAALDDETRRRTFFTLTLPLQICAFRQLDAFVLVGVLTVIVMSASGTTSRERFVIDKRPLASELCPIECLGEHEAERGRGD